MNKFFRSTLLAASVIGASIATSLVLAQVNRSFQMSQDATGFMAADIIARHWHVPQGGGGTPVLSSCGTATITGNDTMGQYTTGAGTTCTLTFASAWPVAPKCFVVPQGNLNFPTYTTSTTALTVTVDVTATTYNYLCIGS